MLPALKAIALVLAILIMLLWLTGNLDPHLGWVPSL